MNRIYEESRGISMDIDMKDASEQQKSSKSQQPPKKRRRVGDSDFQHSDIVQVHSVHNVNHINPAIPRTLAQFRQNIVPAIFQRAANFPLINALEDYEIQENRSLTRCRKEISEDKQMPLEKSFTSHDLSDEKLFQQLSMFFNVKKSQIIHSHQRWQLQRRIQERLEESDSD